MRDEGYACRVSVKSQEAARHILTLLSVAFVFKTSEPIERVGSPSRWDFRIPYGPGLTHKKLTVLLSSIPGVRLGTEWARSEAG